MSSFSAVELQRIKLEEAQMKKKVIEDKKKKELEAKEKEEKLKQLQEAKLASANSLAQQSNVNNQKATNNVKKSALPPTGQSSTIQRPQSSLKTNNAAANSQAKGSGANNKVSGPTAQLKKVISFEDIEEQRVQKGLDDLQQVKPKEIKNPYNNVTVKDHQKEQIDIKEQYLIQLQIQEQMRKIQKTQQLKQQQAKQQNMMAKKQVIEELLNQANSQNPPTQGKQINNLVDLSRQQNKNGIKQEDEILDEIEDTEIDEQIQVNQEDREDLNDTVDYNENKNQQEDSDSEQQQYINDKERKQQSTSVIGKDLSNQQNSLSQKYQYDSLNALPPVQSQVQTRQSLSKMENSQSRDNNSKIQMVQSQNYVGEGQIIELNARESITKSKQINQISQSPQKQSAQKKPTIQKEQPIRISQQEQKSNLLKQSERISNVHNLKNQSQKTEYENVSIKGQKDIEKLDVNSRVSELNKQVRDKIFQDEVDYTESIQIDSSIPLFNNNNQKISSSSKQSIRQSNPNVDKVNNFRISQKDELFESKTRQSQKNNFPASSSPCIQQEDSDRSNQASGEQKNSSQNSKNLSRISSDSQNLIKNLSHTSSGSQRLIKQSGLNERFPIFNKGSQVKVSEDDSEDDNKKYISEKSQHSYKQSSSNQVERNTDIFQQESDEDYGDQAIPIDNKKFQTFKSKPTKLQGSYYNDNEEEENVDEEIDDQNQHENYQQFNQSEGKFQQTEFEELGNDQLPLKKASQLMVDSKVRKSNSFQKKCEDDEEIKQLSDYSDQHDNQDKDSDEDNEELQDQASLSTKLQRSKQEDEPMVVSFGIQNQKNQLTFGKQNNLEDSNRNKSGSIRSNNQDEPILSENFQTFGARDSNKLIGISNQNQDKKNNELQQEQKKSLLVSKDFNESQKLPYYEKTAQFNDEGNPFKQLKQKVKQVKQMQQLTEEEIFQKKQQFEKKRSDILKDAEDNLKKVMNDKIKMAESNKFQFDDQEENESYLNNKSSKSIISQNKSSSTNRQELLNNMRKKKDQQVENDTTNQKQQKNPYEKFSNNYQSQLSNVSAGQKSQISDFQYHNQTLSNNSDKMSTPEGQSYQRNSFDMKFQEAYEQYDQSNSQNMDESPMQFVSNIPQSNQQQSKKYNEPQQSKLEQESTFGKKETLSKEKKGWNIPSKPQQVEDEDLYSNKNQVDPKKRKMWDTSKPATQQSQDQNLYENSYNEELSQSYGQASNVMPNKSNYHSKLQRLHESEEFQDNEFIEPTLKSKIEEESLRDSYNQRDNNSNNQPKLWPTRNIKAGGNRGYKGYSQNGNQMELERDEDEQDNNYGYGNRNNYQNQNNQYHEDDDEDYDQQEDQENENYDQYEDNNNGDNEYEDNQEDQDYQNEEDNEQNQYQEEDQQSYFNQYKRGGNQNRRNEYDDDEEQDQEDYGQNNDNSNDSNEEKSQNISPYKDREEQEQEYSDNNQNRNEINQQEDQEDMQKQIQKGVAMTIDFGDKDDDELEKKKKAFEIKRLKKIQELEQQKQKKLQEMQQKQQMQGDEQQLSGQKEKKIPHKRVPSQQIQQQKQKIQENQPKSESNTPSNKYSRKTNENQNQFSKNQQNIFVANQKELVLNQNVSQPKSPNLPVKERVKLPAIAKKKENNEEENKSDFQENFTPKPSVLETPSTKPRIPFSKPSNKQLISQAITKVCLAGPTNSKERDTAIKKIKDSPQEHFIVLFKGINGRQDFKALYSMDSNTSEVKKVYGLNTAPPQIDLNQIQAFYRYDSGSKEFKEILVKAFSSQVDAVLLKK